MSLVACHQISQNWHVGAFAPATVELELQAGDAILAGGVYWGDLPRKTQTAPRDENGRLECVVDQGPATVGARKPPVFAQLYLELDAAAGRHILHPPGLGGVAGDGTFYVLQLRGVTRLRAARHARVVGKNLPDLSIHLPGIEPGDLVVALGGFDNTTCRGPVAITISEGFVAVGTQTDGADNVPSLIATGIGTRRAVWSWDDSTANVAVAAIAAFGP